MRQFVLLTKNSNRIKWLTCLKGGKEMKRMLTFFLAVVFAISLVGVASAAKKEAPAPTPTPAPEMK